MNKPYLIYRHMDASPARSIAGCIDRVKDLSLRPGQYEIKLTGHFDGYWQEYGLYVDDAAKLKLEKRSTLLIQGYPGTQGPARYNRVPHKELYYGADTRGR